jgi:nitroimidazol reductase NimA-like FMN-containing flavoprotein (pyridoxamine 5'-phosphate oxidase superfamily)
MRVARGEIEELSEAEIDAFLREQIIGRIGCHVDGLTYVVPVIYAYDGESIWVYTIEGQKTQMMRANPAICFETDEYERGSWRSVIVQGRYVELDGDGSQKALMLLADRFASRRSPEDGERRQRASGRPTVAFRIEILEATGRTVVR